MTYSSWDAVTAAKVKGIWNFHQVLGTLPVRLDFFIMLSSVTAIIGGRRVSHYAAANTFLDAFASFRQSQNLVATSLNLGPVVDAGWLADNDGGDANSLSQWLGADAVTVNEVLTLIAASISGLITTPQCITGLKLTPQTINQRFWALDTKFKKLRMDVKQDEPSDQEQVTFSLSALLAEATTKEDRERLVCQALMQKLGAMLMIPVEEINPMASVINCGLDSLAAIELRNWISRELGVHFKVLEILGSPTLQNLAHIILTRRKNA